MKTLCYNLTSKIEIGQSGPNSQHWQPPSPPAHPRSPKRPKLTPHPRNRRLSDTPLSETQEFRTLKPIVQPISYSCPNPSSAQLPGVCYPASTQVVSIPLYAKKTLNFTNFIILKPKEKQVTNLVLHRSYFNTEDNNYTQFSIFKLHKAAAR